MLACGALAAPFALIAGAGRGLVEPLSRAAVDALSMVSAPLQPLVALPVVAEAPLELDEPDAREAMPETTTAGKAPAARKGQAPRPPASGALFVSAAKVLELSRTAVRPQGAFVPATATHPAGLRLSRVAALGIGVQDGDILIEAMGVSPQSPGQIIGAIIAARVEQARHLSGTLWRRGQVLRITVEQPYLHSASVGGAGGTPSHETGAHEPYLAVAPTPTESP